ncbi:hypothetical protein [Haladaptatus salinisoli]|uniref:hypothetical protein n=1 Tax=Haladaptatus salinisoli TaxID=2884876 RepID=UPI001D0B36BC|nr:hypothetical protein [Haladaptatus salinisoli]
MNTENYNGEPTNARPNHSRRDFVKRGALAAGFALGVTATENAAAQDRIEALVYTDDYIARTPFRVVAELPISITIQLLSLPNGNNVPEISQPDDYNGYTIRYSFGDGNVVDASYVFTTGTLREGISYRFAPEANFLNGRLNLLSTTVSRVDGQ